LGFDVQDKTLRRAGLDYDEIARVHVHAGLDACLEQLPGARLFCVETSGTRRYSDTAFTAGDVLIFGGEKRGLPRSVLDQIPSNRHLELPMQPGNRSINLSNCVAIVVYEAWRQLAFNGAVSLT
jgi:tRNA (cytidine/uridine-2'-O-)-methyltransferase